MFREPGNDRGVILIALLWILTVMSVMALSFARETFVEVGVARNAKDLADAYYIARAGIQDSVYQLYQRTYLTPRTRPDAMALAPDPIDLGKVTGQFGDGEYEVDIQEESGKINPNVGNPVEIAERLRSLAQIIGIGAPDADIIVDSIMDWVDLDSNARANGAEDDYYQTLNPPYHAKNAPMTTVEELLMVRGVTPDYFYGRRERTPEGDIIERYGLSRYLTTYSMTDRVNVNSAPLPVLLSIPGMPPGAAQILYDRRHEKPFENYDDINKEVGTSLGPNTLRFLSMQRTGPYTLVATGHRTGSKVRRVIRAVITQDPNEATRFKFIYWNENVPNW